ncbi:uncharacterized protein LOC132169334 [Corylus avellana]|uniref:uncharacterized protein LOC132169334 n=1 Tax=Corylus avellana TaxID=13451 RepID=UPI00286A84C5|nr:uncharacterized protein LOC132169334 [Corylus avellana]
MVKLAFALTIASRKLHPYFEAHSIKVLTEYPHKKALKGFLAEFTNLLETQECLRDEVWVIYVDGSSRKKNGGAEVVLITLDGEELRSSLRLEFKSTNNEAKYEVVLAGVSLALEMGTEFVENFFKKFCIIKIPRKENEQANHLARIGSATEGGVKETKEPVQILLKLAINKERMVLAIEVMPKWAEELVEFLAKGTLPTNKKKVVQLRTMAARFSMVNGTIYKRRFMLPILKCVSKEEGDYILREIHEGIYGSHLGARMLAHKAVRAGFYWQNMSQDSMKMVRTCDNCQHFANVSKQPPEELSFISSPWPFSQWGVNIVGPLSQGKGGVRFVVVAVDYFTKWAEVEALVNKTTKCMERFLWKNVICRYGIPHAFVTDNGKQFDCDSFRD